MTPPHRAEPAIQQGLPAWIPLCGPEPLLGPGPRRAREAGAGIARPRVRALPDDRLAAALRDHAAAAGVRHREAVFAFDLDRLPGDRHYAGVRFEVRLTGDAVALRLGAGAAPCGTAPGEVTHGRYHRAAHRLRDAVAAPRVFGVLRPAFGFTLGAEPSRPLPRRSYRMRVLLELPPGATDVAGALTVAAAVGHPGGLLEAAPATAEAFRVPVDPGSPEAPEPVVRLCVAAGLDPPGETSRAVELLTAACRVTGLRPSAVEVRERADGWFAVLPPTCGDVRAVHGLVAALHGELSRLDPGPRLRLAVCRAVPHPADTRATAAALHRTLDSPSVRSALADEPRASLALALSASLYTDLATTASGDLPPASFRPTTATLPEKGFAETAWLLLAHEA
ncbi:hypothetical protein [Sphaerisporangium aureirubrum]|uniref:Uncharacterized protein n=1 Tax=Sphaerisporangium aureirubrum TaxID=1544736 RepID=A0ABW1NT45_9ACTN